MAPAVAKGIAADRAPQQPNCFAPSLETRIRSGGSAFRVAVTMLGFGVPSQASKSCWMGMVVKAVDSSNAAVGSLEKQSGGV
jgi:hypothetical protein